jgi:GT2 family glycosyltransferase
MIRKTLWAQLGGFDIRYAPAYYEDTDLCFAARQADYKVFYCHNSEVIHHEGITAGTDINSGYKAFQAINHDKFMEKWQDVLATHLPPPPETSPDEAAFRWMVQ